MRDIVTKYGINAGKIWTVLDEKGSLNEEDLISTTKLKENDLHIGIGWLARENKIQKDNNRFKLDKSNMDKVIGSHAGRVWKILDIWGDADLESIMKLSDLKEKDIYTALGWLARENKITLDQKNRFILKE